MNPEHCFCGLPLVKFLDRPICKKHGEKCLKKPERKKIGRYSGQSRTPFGKYEDR